MLTFDISMLFFGLKPAVRNRVIKMGTTFRLDQGDWLFDQGDFANNLYLIQSGQISLVMEFREGLMDRLPSLGPGEVLGWSAIVPPHEYTMGAVADVETIVIGFSGEKLLAIMAQDCESGYYIYKQISELIGDRLTSVSTQLMSLKV